MDNIKNAEIIIDDDQNHDNNDGEYGDLTSAVLELNDAYQKELKEWRGAAEILNGVPSKVSTFTLNVELPKAYQTKLHMLRDFLSLNYSHVVMNMIDKTFEENRKAIDDFYAM